MKKLFIISALIFCSLSAFSQMSISSFEKKIENMEGCFSMKVGPFLLWLGGFFAGPNTIPDGLDRVVMHELSDCSEEQRKSIYDEAKRIQDDDYALWMEVRDGKEHVIIWAKENNEIIQKFVLFVQDEQESMMMRLEGDLDMNKLLTTMKVYD